MLPFLEERHELYTIVVANISKPGVHGSKCEDRDLGFVQSNPNLDPDRDNNTSYWTHIGVQAQHNLSTMWDVTKSHIHRW